ncbi:MAG: 30S ribosomal protein S4, partial [Candidatus Methanomethylicus sp.]|nr:30S ribosomal protein S4 [Candidatus Methanomethylicus sp.]
ILKSYRNQASAILALEEKVRVEKERDLIKKLARQGLLNEEAVLDNILGLNVDDILERRLQTIILKLRLAATTYQARQLITHGHISIGERRVTSPGYLVSRDEEQGIRCAITMAAAPEPATARGA